MTTSPLRIVVADDNALLREGQKPRLPDSEEANRRVLAVLALLGR
jgi:hypothetical protein